MQGKIIAKQLFERLVMLSRDNKNYLISFIILSIILLMPIWSVTYLPLGDFPEHAAQLKAITDYGYYRANHYAINWFTPYLFGYALALFLAMFMPVITACKIVLSISLLAVPVATAVLIRELNGNRYWVWGSFPVAYSFSFHWGFFSYVVAIPIVIFFFAFAHWYSTNPLNLRSVCLAAGFSLLLFCSHSLAWLFAIGAAVGIIFMNHSSGSLVRKILPMLLIVPLVMFWISRDAPANTAQNVELGNYSERYVGKISNEISNIASEFSKRSEKGEHWQRVKELLSFSIGMPAMMDFVLIAALVLSWPLWLGAKLTHKWRRYLPFASVLVLHMVTPYWLFGTAYVYERFAVFLIPASMFCFEHRSEELAGSSWFGRLKLIVPHIMGFVVIVGVLSITNVTFGKFRQNDKDFKEILTAMKPEKRVLQLIFDQGNAFKYSPPYLHFGSWYQAEKRGEALPNFAHDRDAANVVLRYKGAARKFPSAWEPSSFNWTEHDGESYDYFLVRAHQSKKDFLEASGGKVALISQKGAWQLFGRTELAEPR